MSYATEQRLEKLTDLKKAYDKDLIIEHTAEKAFFDTLSPEQSKLYRKMVEAQQTLKSTRTSFFILRDELAKMLEQPKPPVKPKISILKRK